MPSSELLLARYQTSDRLIDFFSNIYITSASSSQDFCSFAIPPWGYLGTRCIPKLPRPMTHDQHNEAPNLLQHVSDIFPCHSTCKPSNLRFSSLPTCLSEFVNILPCYSLLSVSCSMFLLYTIVLLLRPSAIILIIQQSSIPSSSNISFCTIHSFIRHAFQISTFFNVKHATTPFHCQTHIHPFI